MLAMVAMQLQGNYRAGRALFALGEFKEALTYFSSGLVHISKRGEAGPESKEGAELSLWKVKARQVCSRRAAHAPLEQNSNCAFLPCHLTNILPMRGQAYQDQKQQQEHSEMEKQRLQQEAAAAAKAAGRYKIDYSRFEHLGDEDEANEAGSGIEELVLDPTASWATMNKVPSFNRSESEALLQKLSSAPRAGAHDLDSTTLTVFSGLRSLLSNLSVLQLPQRRLRQLLQPSMLQAWHQAVEQASCSFGPGSGPCSGPGSGSGSGPCSGPGSAAAEPLHFSWLVAGLGVGASLISAARLTGRATFVGPDVAQPSLLRVLRETLHLNNVKVGKSDASSRPESMASQQPPPMAGLASLRKERVTRPAHRGLLGGASAALHPGSLETMSLVPDCQRFQGLVLDPEVFDDGLIGRRLLPSVRNAHRALLVPGAPVVPRTARLWGALVEVCVTPNPEHVLGIDLSTHADRCGWASSSYESMQLGPEEGGGEVFGRPGVPWRKLSEAFEVWSIPLSDGAAMLSLPQQDSWSTKLKATNLGRANAIVTWFDLDMGGGCGEPELLSTSPSQRQIYWNQCVHWLAPFRTEPGFVVGVSASRTDTATCFRVVLPPPITTGGISDGGKRLPEPVMFGKLPVRSWEVLGSRGVVVSCRKAITRSVGALKQRRRDPRAGGVRVLELQCGVTGSLMSMLALKSGATRALACDMNLRLIEESAKLAKANGCLAATPPEASGLRYSSTSPSKLKVGGDVETGLSRPVDMLILPLPEQGLFQGGLLKMLRAIKSNSALLASDAVIFPSKVSVWVQLVETESSLPLGSSGGEAGGSIETSMVNCGPIKTLLNAASSTLAPSAIDLLATPHHALSHPIEILSLDLATVLRRGTEPNTHFSAKETGVSIVASGQADAAVWWWTLELCHGGGGAAMVSSAPGNAGPWLQVTIFHEPCPKLILRSDPCALSNFFAG